MDKKETILYKLGNVFGLVFVGCLMAVLVALTVKIILLIF